MTDKLLLLTTVASREEAQTLATALVERRLAACVNILGPIASVYRWQGKVEHAGEFLLLIKSTAERQPALEEAVRGLHSYQVPELIAFRVDSGLPAYLEWITASVSAEKNLT
jgi:periplasmic divalent cation tolerance protein